MNEPDRQKNKRVLFHLDHDDDGYPPSEAETLWVLVTDDGYYEIDNIPFFVTGIASGDVISAKREDDMLVFDSVIRYSGHSTIRVVVFDVANVEAVRFELFEMGCASEQSHLPSLFSVDVPPSVDLSAVQAYLALGEADGRWSYEEAALAK